MVRTARFVVIASLLVGCSQGAGTTGDVAPPASAANAWSVDHDAPSRARGVVLGQVVTHDAEVTILGGGGDLRVVVRAADGTLLADGVSLADLHTCSPALHRIVTSAFAQQTGYVDATLDTTHLN
jgi:hypothetical protein